MVHGIRSFTTSITKATPDGSRSELPRSARCLTPRANFLCKILEGMKSKG